MEIYNQKICILRRFVIRKMYVAVFMACLLGECVGLLARWINR